MLFSENLYFLILFTLPAAVNTIYNAHIRNVPRWKDNKSVELAENIIFCLAVFILNVLIMKQRILLFIQYLSNDKKGANLQALVDFNYIDFAIRYSIVNLITSIVVIVVWNLIVEKIFRLTKNKINDKLQRPKELKFGDVWSNIFETKEIIKIDNCIIRIEKSGKLVTAGIICTYSSPNNKNKEFAVHSTELVKQIFEDDEKVEYDLRMLKSSICEYYDIQNDILIKFYDSEAYDRMYGEKR